MVSPVSIAIGGDREATISAHVKSESDKTEGPTTHSPSLPDTRLRVDGHASDASYMQYRTVPATTSANAMKTIVGQWLR